MTGKTDYEFKFIRRDARWQLIKRMKKMSREEAGRKGGKATSKNHDKEFYQEIGEKGGEATSKNQGKEFYEEIGKKRRQIQQQPA